MSKIWYKQTFFTLVEHGTTRIFDAITTFTLIRIFTSQQFGLFSVYQSWVGFLLVLLPTLEIVLYRNYGDLKASGKLARELHAYKIFNYIKLFLVCIFVFSLSFIPQPENFMERLGLLAFAFALPFSQAFYGYMRETLRFEMKQKKVAMITALQRIFVLLAVVLAFIKFSGNAFYLSMFAILTYIVFAFVWKWGATGVIPAANVPVQESIHRIRTILTSIVLWIHFTGVITQGIQTLDMLALHTMGIPLKDIGNYSIALKAANFFQFLPVALVNVYGVYLGKFSGRNRSEVDERKFVFRYSFYFILLSIFLFMIGIAIAEPLLSFLGKGKLEGSTLTQTTQYFYWMLAGTLIQCASYPLSAYLGARATPKKLFLNIFLPWLFISAILYFSAASSGLMLTAKMNVLVYLVLVVLFLYYILKKTGGFAAGALTGSASDKSDNKSNTIPRGFARCKSNTIQ